MKIPQSFTTPLKSLSLIALTLALSVAIQTSALSTWTPATASAPGGNVSTPLNTGLNTQSKLGGLFINTSNTQPFDIGLSVFGKTVLNGDVVIATGSPAAGKVLTALDTNGTVGWGTATGGGGGNSVVITVSSVYSNDGNNRTIYFTNQKFCALSNVGLKHDEDGYHGCKVTNNLNGNWSLTAQTDRSGLEAWCEATCFR